MTRQRAVIMAALTVTTAVVAWILFVGLPRWTTAPQPQTSPSRQVQTAAPADASPRIQARLFYVSKNGVRLHAVEREVDFAETPVLQARRILEAQLAPPAAPLVSAIPEGTRLKNIYVTDAGIAFVDLSGEISSRHPGGSLGEILTVYSVVSALTENLPAITGVQMLIDGRQVETLAGHIDLRRPLEKTDRWIEPATDSPPAAPTQDTAARTSVVR